MMDKEHLNMSQITVYVLTLKEFNPLKCFVSRIERFHCLIESGSPMSVINFLSCAAKGPPEQFSKDKLVLLIHELIG